MTRFRQNEELSGFVATPACGNGDPIFIVDEVTKFAGVEQLSLRKRLHGVSGELFHSNPLSSTFNHFAYQGVNKKLTPHLQPLSRPVNAAFAMSLGLLCKIDNRLRLRLSVA